MGLKFNLTYEDYPKYCETRVYARDSFSIRIIDWLTMEAVKLAKLIAIDR